MFKRTKPNFFINRSNRLFESDPYVWFWTMIYHFYYFLYYDISKTLNRTRQKDRNFTSVLELYIQYYYKLCFYFKLNVKFYSTKTNFYNMCCFSSRGRRLFHTDKGSSLVISLDIFCWIFFVCYSFPILWCIENFSVTFVFMAVISEREMFLLDVGIVVR